MTWFLDERVLSREIQCARDTKRRIEKPSWIDLEYEPIGNPTIDSTGKQDDQCNGDNCEDASLDPSRGW